MLRKRIQEIDGIVVTTILLVGAAVVALVMTLLLAGSAGAAGGGIGMKSKSGKAGKARLLRNGRAIPPPDAPRRVVRAIKAGNKIRRKPYRYGGGHRRFKDRGYDCSGAVSFALRGGRLLRRPLDSRGLARWKRRGKGRWLTVYGAPSHAYMVVAGLRFDTSMVPGNGPGWSRKLRSTPERYRKRRAPRL